MTIDPDFGAGEVAGTDQILPAVRRRPLPARGGAHAHCTRTVRPHQGPRQRTRTRLKLLPQSLEPAARYPSVMDGMPRVAVAEVVLHCA